jgi:hypothetical protein
VTYEEPDSSGRPAWVLPAVAVLVLVVAAAVLAFLLTRGGDDSALVGDPLPASPSPTASPTPEPESPSPTPEAEETEPAEPAEPAEPDYSNLTYPFGCPADQIAVRASEDVDFTGDGRPEAVRLVVCDTGAGTPSSVLVVFTAAADGTPQLLATLLSETDNELVQELTVSGTTIRATGEAYSSDDVPRCCPDLQVDERWDWNGSEFVRS